MKYDGMAAVAAPAKARLHDRLQQAMLALLAFFVFALPLVEAPKNIAAGIFVAAWAWRAAITRDLGGRWNPIDTAFALMLASALASGLAGYAGDVSGVFRVFLLAWVVSRSRFDEQRFAVLAGAACLGLLVALPFAAIPFLRGTRQFFELPSVGQVNQSALYIAILTASAFGWWLQGARSGQAGRRRAGLALCATVFCAALLVSASRAAWVACAVAVALIVACVAMKGRDAALRRVLARTALTLGGLAVLVAGLTTWAPNLSDHKLTPDRIASTFSMSNRMQHWRIGVEGWRQRPWLGWGPDGFQRVTVQDVCGWRTQRGETCNPKLYVATKHAHSLYVATLVERGVLGVLALALFMAVWAWTLVRSAGTAAASPLWVASAVGLVVALVGGFFNTTLRVEHGSLAVLWFGLWIAAHGRSAARPGGQP
jgi:O-antigen ligase